MEANISYNPKNTLFNRIIFLNLKLNKYQTKQLGQIVKNLYFEQYNVLPDKTVIDLKDRKGEYITRLVAYYPSEFVIHMDRVISKYAKEQETALKYRKSKFKNFKNFKNLKNTR